MKYALFLGCLIPAKLPHIESSTKEVAKKFGVEFYEMDFVCCPNPVNIKQLDLITWLSIGARNISLAEEKNMDIVSPCNGCTNTFMEVNHILKEDKELKAKINEILKEINKKYKGTIEVKHWLKVLHEDIGIEKIKAKVKKKLRLKIATFYGCHILRPSEIMNVSNKAIEEIVYSLGGEVVDYSEKELCCGSGLGSIAEDVSIEMVREKLKNIKKANADAIAVVCPNCFQQLDLGQFLVARKYKERYEIPVFYISQLIGFAIGLEEKELGFSLHKVKVERVLEKVK